MRKLEFDAHIYGPVFSQSGVGESTRAYWATLTAAGFNIGIWPQAKPFDSSEKEFESKFAKYLVYGPHDRINFYRINAEEVRNLPSKVLNNEMKSTKILIPMWETPILPKVWEKDVEKFDAVICATHFIAKAFSRIKNLKTYVAPHSINVEAFDFSTKKMLQIRDDNKLIVYSFSYASFITRKNPNAFTELFHHRNQELHIRDETYVLLASDTPRNKEDLKFEKKISEIVSKNFYYLPKGRTRKSQLSFLKNADVFVSCHRSEGIGLQIVESALLNTAVVSHLYSGPEDFLDNSYPGIISHTTKLIDEGEYPNAEGQIWADYSIYEMSDTMNKLAANPDANNLLKDKIQTFFSMDRCMKLMSQIMDENSKLRSKE